MADTTETAVRNMMGGLDNVSAAAINQAIADAKKFIEGDGFADGDTVFELVHRFYTGHLLQSYGLYRRTTSESVKDVSRSYESTRGTKVSGTGSTSFLGEYTKCKTKKFGIGERVAIN